jgi:hypothetical protein
VPLERRKPSSTLHCRLRQPVLRGRESGESGTSPGRLPSARSRAGHCDAHELDVSSTFVYCDQQLTHNALQLRALGLHIRHVAQIAHPPVRIVALEQPALYLHDDRVMPH